MDEIESLFFGAFGLLCLVLIVGRYLLSAPAKGDETALTQEDKRHR